MTAMANEMADDILLRVTGAEGVEVAGECSLRTTERERALRFSRTVPFEERLAGQGVRCRFDVAGRAEIEFRMNGNVSRTRTAGGVVRGSIGSREEEHTSGLQQL